jgi:putative transposase
LTRLVTLMLTRAASPVKEAYEQTLACDAFPKEHRRRLWTNDPLERLMHEIRGGTRVVGALPEATSCLNLARPG